MQRENEETVKVRIVLITLITDLDCFYFEYFGIISAVE